MNTPRKPYTPPTLTPDPVLSADALAFVLARAGLGNIDITTPEGLASALAQCDERRRALALAERALRAVRGRA